MKKLLFFAALAIAPFLLLLQTHAEKNFRKGKKPKPMIIGKADTWREVAALYHFTGTLIIYTTDGIDTMYARGGMDICVAWYDGQSRITDCVQIGGKGKDSCYCMTERNSANVFLTGAFSDTAYFGDTAHCGVSYGGTDAFTVRIFNDIKDTSDASPQCKWIRTAGGIGNDRGLYLFKRGDKILTRGYYQAEEKDTLHFGTPQDPSDFLPGQTGLLELNPEYSFGSGRLSSRPEGLLATDEVKR